MTKRTTTNNHDNGRRRRRRTTNDTMTDDERADPKPPASVDSNGFLKQLLAREMSRREHSRARDMDSPSILFRADGPRRSSRAECEYRKVNIRRMSCAPNEQAGNPYFFKKKKGRGNPLQRGALLPWAHSGSSVAGGCRAVDRCGKCPRQAALKPARGVTLRTVPTPL